MVAFMSHAPLGGLGMLFLAGAIVMMFFVVLSGLNDTQPLKSTYFLRAETEGISGARDITQWTYFYICGKGNTDCSTAYAALPFGYAWDSDPKGAPDELVGKHGHNTTSHFYFFVWRFGWVFYLIGLFFTVCSLFSGLFACIGRLGARIAMLSTIIALLFYSVAVSLMTVEFVKARDVFNKAGMDASIGRWAFGFSWGAWAAIFIAIVFFFIGGRLGRHGSQPPRSSGSGRFGTNLFGRGRRRSRTPGVVKDEYH